MTFQVFLKLEIWNNTVQKYLVALGVLIGLFIIFKIFKGFVLKKLEKWSKQTKTDIDNEIVEILETIPGWFYSFLSFYLASQTLKTHPLFIKTINALFIIISIYWATRIIGQIIEYLLKKFTFKKGKTQSEKTSTYFALALLARIILWSVGILLILSNLGINISALVASLGIGGIAVALAAQNILGDIFSSFSIYFDKPFEVGDYVIVGGHRGTIKKIGLKTTRLTALQGEEIVISNRELTSTRIQNFKKMKRRRISFQLGLTYDTPNTKLKKVPQLIAGIIEKIDNATHDRTNFMSFGDHALLFETVYFVLSSNYKEYMDLQEEVNLEIKTAFEKEKIEFAFPTQTIHLVKS